MLTSTGKAAISHIFHSLLSPGDGVLVFAEAYKSTRFYAERLLSKFGINVFVYSLDERTEIEELCRSGAIKLLMLESPTNPQTRVPEITYFCELAHRYGAIVALDNSMSGFHQHGELPVDLFVHSLSKFASAGADVMGGAIIGDRELVSKIRQDTEWGTDVLDPRAAHTILKGMTTYWMRRERQASSALKIAEYLSTHAKVRRTLYPGLTSHPDHKHAVAQMKDFGVLVSFDTDGDEAAMKRVVNATKRFRIAFGSAFPTSIIAPCWLFYSRTFPAGEIANYGVNRNTIRLSIGLEEPESLIEDLEQALKCI
jgi:cystathionine beta-lyase/cystathionine gamma-synthase